MPERGASLQNTHVRLHFNASGALQSMQSMGGGAGDGGGDGVQASARVLRYESQENSENSCARRARGPLPPRARASAPRARPRRRHAQRLRAPF